MPVFISLFSLFFLFIFDVSNVDAVTLNKSTYDYGEEILYVENVGATMFFDLNSDTANFLGSEHEAGFNINEGGAVFDNGNYIIMEHQSGDNDCYWNPSPTEPYTSKLEECRNSPEFINEFSFTVRTRPSGGGGEEEPELDEELKPAMGVMLYPPEVSISSILKGAFYSNELNIGYRVTDENDLGMFQDKLKYGLGENPTIISYSDKVSDYFDSLSFIDKTEIAKEQPVQGNYLWSVKNLQQGILYRIIVDAVDNFGMWGQAISEFFGVDFSAPVFTVKVNPPAVRNGDVTIIVYSSEDLSKIPEVKVVQNGGTPQSVIMTGEKNHFEGIYKVLSGFDGPAVIKVSGYDVANNLSTEIVSGGIFSVGVNPPPKPKIDNYKEKIVTNNEFIDFSGISRVDTEVILSVNGTQISKVKPDDKGVFAFNQIKLDKTKNNGTNYVDIVAIDALETLSESALIEVKYNIPPTIVILNPKEKETLSNIYSINVEGKDENSDTLFYTYQILALSKYKNKVYDWVNISEGNPSKSFSYNTAELEDGSYVLQVKVSDKNAEVISLPVFMNVKNVLPSFLFEDGRSTITNQSNVSVRGKAVTSLNLSPRPSIVSVAYSMDKGLTWTPVKIESVKGNYEKKFVVEFTNLSKEGTYPVLWRTKDSRDFIGLIVHPIIIDKTAPKAPTILSPRIDKDVIISDSNDENLSKEGIQINIKGTTEGYNNVTLNYNNQILTTKALATGEFNFKDVSFTQKGRYNIDISVTDQAGNKSGVTSFYVLYNNLPVISFINPKPFRGISGLSNISWNIKDSDGEKLSNVVVSYRNKDKDKIFKTLVSNGNAIGNYNWNTSGLAESNNYELKIEVSDGYSVTSSTESFSIDRTAPILTSFVFDKNITNEKTKQISFVGKGEATDNLSGIEFVEYSLEDNSGMKTPWYKGIVTSGYLKNKATYQIKHPLLNEDGEYKVHARAVDTSGNVSEPLVLSLSLDKTAPRVGGFFFEKNNINLIPDEQASIVIYQNSFFKFNVSLEEDTGNATIRIGTKEYELKKDVKTNLWSANVSVNSDNREKLFITAEDKSLNKVKDKEIGSVLASKRGTITRQNENKESFSVVGASINVLKLNEETNQYNDFIFADNSSSVLSNESGEYDLILPAGDYKFVVSGNDIKTLKHKLNLNRSSIVNEDFRVSKTSKIIELWRQFLSIFK